MKYTIATKFTDLTKVLSIGDTVKVLSTEEFKKTVGLIGTSLIPNTRIGWGDFMISLVNTFVSVKAVTNSEITVEGGWSLSKDSFYILEEEEESAKPEEFKSFYIDISTGFDDSYTINYSIRELFNSILPDMDWSHNKGYQYCEYNPNTGSFGFSDLKFSSEGIKDKLHFVNEVKKHRNGGPSNPAIDNINGPYKKGDYVLLKSLEEARKTNWYDNNDVPNNWGGSSESIRNMFGTKAIIVKDDRISCVIMIDKIHRTVHKSHIEKIIPYEVENSVSDSSTIYEELFESSHKYKVGDTVYRLLNGKPVYATIIECCLDDADPFYKIKNASADVSLTGWYESSIKGIYTIGEVEETPETIGKYKVGDRVYRGTKGNIAGSDSYDEATITKLIYRNGKHIFYEITDTLNNISSTGWSEKRIKGLVPTYEEEIIPEEPQEPEYVEMTIKKEIMAMMPTPILLEGDVGSGKSTILIELAKELKLKYFAMVMSDATTAGEFKGYKNVVDGTYVAPEFRDAFENGGMFVLEELNATTSNMPIIFNSLENGYFVFADKLVYAHKDFRLCATMNTITNSHDFGGRRPLDKSVRNRFHTMIIKTNFEDRFPINIVYIRDEILFSLQGFGSTKEVGPRELTRFMQLVEIGINPVEAVYKTIDIEQVLSSVTIKEIIRKSNDYIR